MLTALYYPHTVIHSRNLLKTALLLWDSVECIVPRKPWQFEHPFKEKAYNEAIDLVIRPRVPSNDHREQAHFEVANFLREEGSHLFLQNAFNHDRRFQMYPEKFLYRTWDILEHEGLAHFDSMSREFNVPPALGLLMMSSIANACAGTQKQKVTDRIQAYSLLERAKATWLGAPFVEGLDASQVAPDLDRLMSISLNVLGAKSIPIKKLVAFRKREAKEKSADYRTLRKNYMKYLNKYIQKLSKDAKSKDDVKEIERDFRANLKDDLNDLKHELNLASIKPLFSKEMIITFLAIGGAFLAPIPGLTTLATSLKGVGIIPLVKTKLDHSNDRRTALRKHKISWLYLTQEKGINLR